MAARKRGEKIRVLRLWRRSLAKIADYTCWVTLAGLCMRSFDEALGVPVVSMGLLLIVYGIEITSCADNYFEYKGVRKKLNFWKLLGRPEIGDALEDAGGKKQKGKRFKRGEEMKILIDNGHGAETPGKRSPDGTLREYKWARETAARIVADLKACGYDAEQVVTEDKDIPLAERCRRVNAACGRLGRGSVILVSVHLNAAGNGTAWMNARGWSAHVSLNASANSKELARRLAEAADDAGLKVRKHSPKMPYWPQNLAVCCDTLCPAVLTENLFMDNREDAAFLLSEEGKEAVARLHVEGIMNYLKAI